MNDNSYNGWANYETWVIKLWIDNDQGEQEYWLERARDEYAASETNAASRLADELHAHYLDAEPELTGVFADLLRHALGMANWWEIARSLIDEAGEILAAKEA